MPSLVTPSPWCELAVVFESEASSLPKNFLFANSEIKELQLCRAAKFRGLLPRFGPGRARRRTDDDGLGASASICGRVAPKHHSCFLRLLHSMSSESMVAA